MTRVRTNPSALGWCFFFSCNKQLLCRKCLSAAVGFNSRACGLTIIFDFCFHHLSHFSQEPLNGKMGDNGGNGLINVSIPQ